MKNPFAKLILLTFIYALTPTTTFAVGESSKADCVKTVQMTRDQEQAEGKERDDISRESSQEETAEGR